MAGKKYKRLTDAQENFVQGIISGKSNYQAYIDAYPSAANWKPQSVHSVAWNLLHTPHVQERYEMLKKQYLDHITEQSFYDRDQLLSDFMFLKDESKGSIEQHGVRQANSNAYVSALKNIGEILALYPDKKVDINANLSSDFEINIINDNGDDDDAKD